MGSKRHEPGLITTRIGTARRSSVRSTFAPTAIARDGIGDFPGLIERLDYLQDLG